MTLNQPYYIDKRHDRSHIALDGEWEFCYKDAALEDVKELRFEHTTEIPSSIYYSLYHAGLLPDPYHGTNSKLYDWVDEKVWYYRKCFTLSNPDFEGNAFLCFEGVSYYARLWINGTLIGDHEGMFGGPVCDIVEHLNLNGENEIILEVKACTFEQKEKYKVWGPKKRNVAEIVPWNIMRDVQTSNGHFAVIGLWNSVRLELVPRMHISRSYLYTEGIKDTSATLMFETEIADGRVKELSPFFGTHHESIPYNNAYDHGLTGRVRDESVQIRIEISDEDGVAYESDEDVALCNYDRMGMNPSFFELQFYRKKIEIQNPKLWYPSGLGEPHLYDVKVTLSYEGKVCDEHCFKFGVRTFTSDYTAGNKYRTQWEKFLFSVNGKEIFVKGMNWMPIDYLYDITPERYEWCLRMVKNQGVQLIRVWNGGGMPEADAFYEICDRLGLMVWQDLFIANATVPSFPQPVLESQTAYNLYRLRNHPSLVLLCGGNEFNPYAQKNAAAMFIMDRTARTLAPDRIFHYTTPDRGSAHVYNDMEPAWYQYLYRQLPFLGESGIHSFPNFKSIKKLISEKEAVDLLPDLSSEAFSQNYPDLLNHFSEYATWSVPRMTARISQIVDMKQITLEDLCEASHVQTYEYYQLMIQAIHANFPRCGGIMPWVFKRPWTTAAIQTVDGNDLPTLCYYSVQNAYRPINIFWQQSWSILAPRETMPLCVTVFNQNGEDLSDTKITLTVYRPDLSVFAEYSCDYSETVDFGSFTLDDGFTDTCFLVCADLSRGTETVARSVYFNKCTSLFNDAELYAQHRRLPTQNLRFDNGPWLKPTIVSAQQATIEAAVVNSGTDGTYQYADVRVKNLSSVPAFPVTLDMADDAKRFFLSDNFFMLKAGEEKTVRLTCKDGSADGITVKLWNGEAVTL